MPSELRHTRVLAGVLAILFELVIVLTQLTSTCSKSTIETLEKGVKYVQN